jgi:hypothetical protein
MRAPAHQPTSIRLPPDVHAEISRVAAAKGITLGEELRQRVTSFSPISEAIDGLRHDLAAYQATQRASAHKAKATPQPDLFNASGADPGMLLEILLLLRDIGGPQRLRAAQAEVERQGLKVWKGAPR